MTKGPRKINTQWKINGTETVEFGGWLQGNQSYLGVWVGRTSVILDGQKLYRLAKAIVKQFEEDREAK